MRCCKCTWSNNVFYQNFISVCIYDIRFQLTFQKDIESGADFSLLHNNFIVRKTKQPKIQFPDEPFLYMETQITKQWY